MKYYYIKDDETLGPLPIEDLVKVIDEDTLVWKADGSIENWIEAKQVPEIFSAINSLGNVKAETKKVPPPPPVKKDSLASEMTASQIVARKETQLSPKVQAKKAQERRNGRVLLFVFILLIVAVGFYLSEKNAFSSDLDEARTEVNQLINDDEIENADNSLAPDPYANTNKQKSTEEEINNDEALGVVGHREWCDCKDCENIRIERGTSGNWVSGSPPGYRDKDYDLEDGKRMVQCLNCKGTGAELVSCNRCDYDVNCNRRSSGGYIQYQTNYCQECNICKGTGLKKSSCRACDGEGRVY